jgi:hypothetical protein
MLSMGGFVAFSFIRLTLLFSDHPITEGEAEHVICVHTHEHTEHTRMLAQAKLLKGRAAADLLPYSRLEASSAKRAFEQLPSLPGSKSSNWACRVCLLAAPSVRGNVRQQKSCLPQGKDQDQGWDSQPRLYRTL